MKILIVCQYFEPEPFRITDIASELQRRGHRVEVLTGIPNYPAGKFYKGYDFTHKRREVFNGVRIKRVPLVPRGKGSALALVANYISFMISGSVDALFEPQVDYDLVFVYQLSPVSMAIPGIVAARRARVPMILYVADLWPESIRASGGTDSRIIYALLDRIVASIYRKSARILITSRGFKDSIRAHGQPEGKIVYVPQYPEDAYRPVEVPADDPARQEIPEGFNIVFTGNIGDSQGLEIVLDAAERLPAHAEINWNIIGDGRARNELRAAVHKRGLNARIRFLGRKPMSRIPTYLALCDVALLCLKPEPLFAITLPAKTQSYLACGIPVVGSIDGDAAHVIEEAQAGLAGPAGDAEALTENVLAMYRKSREERMAMGANARRYFEANFRKESIIDRIELIFEETAHRLRK